MKSYLLTAVILFSSYAQAQVTEEWVQRYNPNGGGVKGLVIDSEGNTYIAGGRINANTGADILLIKYDQAGSQVWLKEYAGPGNSADGAQAINIDNNDNIYVTGRSNNDIITIKYNQDGDQQWVKFYDYAGVISFETGLKVIADSQGNVYTIGQSENTPGSSIYLDFVTIKYNSSGVEQWAKRYNGPSDSTDRPYAIDVDQLGNVYVTGESYGNNTRSDLVVVKYDSSGNQMWVQRYDRGTGADLGYDVKVDVNGNVFVTGGSAASPPDFVDFITIKYSATGQQLWTNIYAGPNIYSDIAYSIDLDNAGDVYVTGPSIDADFTQDWVTIKYNTSGGQQWLQRANFSGASGNESKKIKTGPDGSVYVTGRAANPGFGADYTTIKYNADGEEQWMVRYSGITAASAEEAIDMVLDANSNLYITGMTNLEIATLKYSQGLNITNPVAGDKWIAGETDTIRWNGGQAGQFLIIEYSTDNGATYVQIDAGAPADSNYYVWNIPNNLLSTRCRIKLTDAQTSTELAVSDSFKIKGYVLTRLDVNGQYVAFSPAAHGWSYLNGTLWPQSWFSQFQYSTATDPYTNEPYPSFFHSEPDSNFIDWPLWVEVFGEDQCYWFTQITGLGSSYKGEAQEKWKNSANIHNGSCFGFAASSFLAFNFRDQFFPRHPGIPNVSNIFSLNLTNTIQKTINGYFAYQYGKQSLDNDVVGQAKDPRTTLFEIMNMFKGDSLDIKTITIYNNSGGGGGAHTMAPISVTVDGSGPSRYRVNLYDSNNPGQNTPYIMVDSLNNTWTDFTGLGATWTGNNHFYLEIPVSNYLVTPIMGKHILKAKGVTNIEFYNNEKANVMYTNSSGLKMGVTNKVVTDELQEGIAIFNKNGKPSDPIGYYIPEDSYSIVMDNIKESTAYLSAFKENVIYAFERFDADSTQTDRFRIDEGFSVSSPDITGKEYYITTIADLDTSERIFFIKDIQLRQNDSLFVKEMNQSDLIIKNFGSSKLYELEINERSETEEEIFQNASISLSNNATHILEPNWSDLTNSQLTIYIDEGNDGTIDDTLYVENTVDVKDEGLLLSPDSYNLAQNYPNPFNPVTTIQYSVPQRSNVTLKVYDILGNEIATLVNEEKSIGVYSVSFDASGLASGIYFYKLQAGSFVETKKMTLLR